ncbi:EamA family transporter [Streptomyces sp. NPDC056161]|uniref:EamA family transporter n=1 Tax=Streptomyces sp. NPDC056161 TaxID=3345732 RepID=UPI0035E08B83
MGCWRGALLAGSAVDGEVVHSQARAWTVAPTSAPGPAALSFLRLAVAAVALLAISPVTGLRIPRKRDLPLIAACGLTGMTAYQVLLNWAEVHVEAGTASFLIATPPCSACCSPVRSGPSPSPATSSWAA